MESEKLAMAPKKRGMVTRGWSDFWKPPIFDKERDHQLCDKTVVITGGNCGIGLATAMECAKRVSCKCKFNISRLTLVTR